MFPATILVNKSIYDIKERISDRIWLYRNHKRDTVVVKNVPLDSGELYFHLHVHEICHRQSIFVSPIRIIYNRDDVTVVYPFEGKDTLALAVSNFWTTHTHITLSVLVQLIEQLQVFHAIFMMAMGDIKPDNIVYNSSSGTARYIDLEYTTAQYSVPPTSPTSLFIEIPDPRTRHYSTVTTPCYSSFEKRAGRDYCVFANDEYALATTLFCLLTNRQPPGLSIPPPLSSSVRAHWDAIHATAFKELLVHVQEWEEDTSVLLTYIRTHWKVVS